MDCLKHHKSQDEKTEKRTVKLNQRDGMETLEVKINKQKIHCIINFNNVCEHDHNDNRIIERDKHKVRCKKCSKAKKKEKSLKANNLCKKSSEKSKKMHSKKVDDEKDDSMHSESDSEVHKANLHVCNSSGQSQPVRRRPGLNRLTPQCSRDACKSAIAAVKYSRHLKREMKKLKKIRKREAKYKKPRRGRTLSSISSLSTLSSEMLSLENISSDSFTSYDEYDVSNDLDTLIRRTKHRDKQIASTSTAAIAPTGASSPQPCTQHDTELANTDKTVCKEDNTQEECVGSDTNHSIHSQATLILETLKDDETLPQIKIEDDIFPSTIPIEKDVDTKQTYDYIKRETELYPPSTATSDHNTLLQNNYANGQYCPTLIPNNDVEKNIYFANVTIPKDSWSAADAPHVILDPAYSNISEETLYSPTIRIDNDNDPYSYINTSNSNCTYTYPSCNDTGNFPNYYMPHSSGFIPPMQCSPAMAPANYSCCSVPRDGGMSHNMGCRGYIDNSYHCPSATENPMSPYLFQRESETSQIYKHTNLNAMVNNVTGVADGYCYKFHDNQNIGDVKFDSNSNYVFGENNPNYTSHPWWSSYPQ